MDLSRWPDADALLDEALELPAAQLDSWLERVAARDAALADALARVLRERADESFLAPGGALSGPLAALVHGDATAMEADDVAGVPPSQRLAPGTRFGPYRVVELIGRGGMGEVYRARDMRLERDVALKVLPARWAEDAGRRARFEREARVVASLRHSGIASIHHLEEHEGVMALVLELVEGPTLADRIAESPLDWRDAVVVARSLVDALDAAHQRGIVHRDLKPANIKLPPDGGIKVLDFGLARAFSDEDADVEAGLTTIDGLSGQVMGTPAYMSPEQARGQRVDARTDVWAFGCVLYEMLTGERAFAGETVRTIVSRVLEREPDYTRLPATTPAPLARLLHRCLQKDPRVRLGYIGDAHLELDEAMSPARAGETAGVDVSNRGRHARWRLAAAAAAVVVLAASGWLAWRLVTPSPPARTLRLAVPFARGDVFVPSSVSVLALSPDGSTLVYRLQRQGVTQLYMRRLDSEAAEPLAGTENATGPFFSPDGRWIAFDKDGVLSRRAIAGGPVVAICPAPGGLTGTWTTNDEIIFAAGTSRRLERVSASGGTPTALTTVRTDVGEVSHGLPAMLPGNRAVLFTIFSADTAHVARLNLDTGEITRVVEGRQPGYLPSGHLVFAREGALWVAPYDAASGRMTADPVPAVSPVLESRVAGGGVQYAVASSGTLLYAPARSLAAARALVWLAPGREPTDLPLEPRAISRMTLSHDGTRVAMAMADGRSQDIWIFDIQRGTLSRLTPDAAVDTAPVWSPDGQAIAYRSDQDGGGLFLQPVDGRPTVRLTRVDGPIHTPYDFSPDGRQVLFTEFRSYRDQDVAMVDVATGAVTSLLTDPAAELRPQLSPDGRWIAYQSDESGNYEVYVRPFPDTTGPRWQISSGGGTSPQWMPSGHVLVFDDGAHLRRAVLRVRDGALEPGTPETFITDPPILRDRLGPYLDVAPDGRILAISPNRRPAVEPSPLMVLEGWLPSRAGT